jgi:lactoylglutathione lyase
MSATQSTTNILKGITGLYSADIFVGDVERAIDFYVGKLGFEKRTDEPTDEAGHRWVEVAPKGSHTALILAHGFGHWTPERVGSYTGLIFSVADMASTFETLEAQGVTFEKEPEGSPWGIFPGSRDPDGNVFIPHRDAQS